MSVDKQVQFPITWAFVPQTGSDGSSLIGIQLSGNFFSFIVAMPLDAGDQLAAQFGAALTKAISEIRRQERLSLVVAPANTLDLLRKKAES